MIHFYRIFLWLYPRLAWLIGFTNPKAKKWREGRKGIFKKLSAAFHQNTSPVIWMHVASLGEFEQGLPILVALRKTYPQYKILLTFFSPSGYEVRRNDPSADFIFYLPMDSPSRASRFLNIVQPSLALFVKYEFWYYYLDETRARNIPLLLVSGVFREDQPFFKWYGSMHRRMLSFFSFLFVQDDASAALLQSIGVENNVVVSGDTRFDRVLEIASAATAIGPVENFCGNARVVVAGSTWTDDDEELDHYANTHPEVCFIIAPHDIGAERLAECKTLYKHSILYSEFLASGGQRNAGCNVLIIDNIGMLSRLYRYATVCYVGGGFGDDGIHNILEAAVYAKPVVFGPVYEKYREGAEMLDAGGAFTIDDALELEALLDDLLQGSEAIKAGKAALGYVQSKAGATEKVMRYIQEKRLLIS